MGYNASREARRRRRRRKRILQTVLPILIPIVLMLVILVCVLNIDSCRNAFIGDLFEDLMYSSEKADLNEYFKTTPEDMNTSATVIEECEVTDEKITVKDGRLYLPYETVIEKYNPNFYWEKSSEKLLYTTGDGVYTATPGETFYTLDGTGIQAGYQTCYKEGDIVMVSLDFVRVFTNMEIRLFGGGKEPYRTLIRTSWENEVVADVTKDDVAIRTEPDKDGKIMKQLRKGSTVIIVASEGEKWMRVMSEDLITGYIETKHLGDKYDRPQTPVTNVAPIQVNMVADYSEPVILAWHNVVGDGSAASLKDNEKFLKYINTISPTWFALSDNEGTIASIASTAYVETCHSKGIKVWGLVSNLTYPEVSTSTVLNDPEKRQFMTEQLLAYASQFKLDGINLDFESIAGEDGPAYVQFIREFSLKAHEKNLVVSVDNYVPKEYTSHYNRKEQGTFADYVVIMGYDEHTSASDEAGSVASLGFVQEGIENTLAEVPKEKVINGLPFYTRYWTVDANENIIDMQTLPMTKAAETVSASGVTPEWDEETCQDYAEWANGANKNKIWIENVASLRAKLEVMKAHDIGGAAVWQLAFGTEEAFAVIDEYYRPSADTEM